MSHLTYAALCSINSPYVPSSVYIMKAFASAWWARKIWRRDAVLERPPSLQLHLGIRYIATDNPTCIWTCRAMRVRGASTRRSNSVRAGECLLINEEHIFRSTMRHVRVPSHSNPRADYLLSMLLHWTNKRVCLSAIAAPEFSNSDVCALR